MQIKRQFCSWFGSYEKQAGLFFQFPLKFTIYRVSSILQNAEKRQMGNPRRWSSSAPGGKRIEDDAAFNKGQTDANFDVVGNVIKTTRYLGKDSRRLGCLDEPKMSYRSLLATSKMHVCCRRNDYWQIDAAAAELVGKVSSMTRLPILLESGSHEKWHHIWKPYSYTTPSKGRTTNQRLCAEPVSVFRHLSCSFPVLRKTANRQWRDNLLRVTFSFDVVKLKRFQTRSSHLNVYSLTANLLRFVTMTYKLD